MMQMNIESQFSQSLNTHEAVLRGCFSYAQTMVSSIKGIRSAKIASAKFRKRESFCIKMGCSFFLLQPLFVYPA